MCFIVPFAIYELMSMIVYSLNAIVRAIGKELIVVYAMVVCYFGIDFAAYGLLILLNVGDSSFLWGMLISCCCVYICEMFLIATADLEKEADII